MRLLLSCLALSIRMLSNATAPLRHRGSAVITEAAQTR